jgi:hypothetical protein
MDIKISCYVKNANIAKARGIDMKSIKFEGFIYQVGNKVNYVARDPDGNIFGYESDIIFNEDMKEYLAIDDYKYIEFIKKSLIKEDPISRSVDSILFT